MKEDIKPSHRKNKTKKLLNFYILYCNYVLYCHFDLVRQEGIQRMKNTWYGPLEQNQSSNQAKRARKCKKDWMPVTCTELLVWSDPVGHVVDDALLGHVAILADDVGPRQLARLHNNR